MVSKRGNVPPAVDFQKLLFELAWAKSCKKNPVFNWYTCNYGIILFIDQLSLVITA